MAPRPVTAQTDPSGAPLRSDDGELYFGQTHRPEGFTSAALAQFDGSAEPVIRELLQNSLDAADQSGVPVAEVRFVISEANRDELPGWSKYIAVFKEARRQRRSQSGVKRSQDERMVVERVEGSSRHATIPLLLCIDNGHGLNGERMDALLTPGNTSKGERGAGSFGLGHHAAFGASDLRYVLYGAKYFNKDTSISEIASGHAILASHRDKENVLRAADGYWFRSEHGHLAFNGKYDCYPDTLPRLLWELLAGVETGTIVCIAGFNDFRREEDDPTAMDSIRRVAASNFSDAIDAGRLRVDVEDDCADEAVTVGRDDLGEVLDRYSQNKRAAKQGQINGQVAYSAWKTINLGERLPCHGGGLIRWRPLDASDRQPTRVHIFRKGMWITSRAPRLAAPEFSSTWPFDAVLSLDSGPLEKLVRSAEGPEHRGIDTKRLDNKQKKQYRQLMAEVASQMRAAVGERKDLEDFVPKGFATLTGHDIRTAEPIRRPRLPAGGGAAEETVAGGQKQGTAEKKRARRRGTPRPGSRPRYRTSLRIVETAVIEAHVDYEEDVGPHAELGIRIRAASGADGTCEQPLPDDFLHITSVSDDAGRRVEADEPAGDLELSLPAAQGRRLLRVTLSSPIDDPQLLELDLVKRKTTPPQEDREAATKAS